ncbi:hypothetical protein EXIGLDRAFT_694727 [Exidia glandulosa HHB12029]|uniref:Uncharacterized protein n=1 Tax=Exidia glandulosa HHB12029 TaxID=1314781 RepID=A0A165GEA5_EXIGL|nr:hypothetical protein EXIGLDRAFT_694727 [Exidia glandulosa HHB12029]
MSASLASRISTYALLLLVGGRATLQQESTSTSHTIWPNSTAWTLGDGLPLHWSESNTTACGPFVQLLNGTDILLTFNGTGIALQSAGLISGREAEESPDPLTTALRATLDEQVPFILNFHGFTNYPDWELDPDLGCPIVVTLKNLDPNRLHTLRILLDFKAVPLYMLGPAEVTVPGVLEVSSSKATVSSSSNAISSTTMRRSVAIGSAVGAFALLASVIIALLVRRRFRRRATALSQPRALPPPNDVVPTRDRNPLKDKEAVPAQEPTPDAPERGESEHLRLREALEALAALQNEVQEMRQGDTAETLPEYESRMGATDITSNAQMRPGKGSTTQTLQAQIQVHGKETGAGRSTSGHNTVEGREVNADRVRPWQHLIGHEIRHSEHSGRSTGLYALSISWTPGNECVAGNEGADSSAKTTALSATVASTFTRDKRCRDGRSGQTYGFQRFD